jgi:hypothetical protein
MFHSANMPLPIPQMFTSERYARSAPPKKLILLAWSIEIVAVSVSASLAAHPLITGGEGTIEKWLMAAPFLVIAFAELAKIPAVEAMLRLKGMVLPWVAGFAALLICLNTFYTVSNGFERAHAAKTSEIEAVKREIADFERQLDPITLDTARLQSEKDSLKQQLADSNRREEKELETQRRICEEYARKGMPCTTRTPEINEKYTAERKRIIADIQSIDAKLNALSTSKLDLGIAEKKASLDALIRDNQTYRFAARVYGYDDPTEMTAKELNTFCFVWFGLIAFAVSTLGPLLALCYYRIKFQTAVGRTAWSRLVQTVRRLVLRLARRNKIIKIQEVEKVIERSVEVPVEVVREVEKEVPVERVVTVVQEVVKEVPVDRIVPVEKPVEVKVKEVVYLPIFTNDPDVLKGHLA